METFDALMTRRSIREYKSDTIPDKLLERILRAAMQAPSARNLQPWHFVIINRRDVLDSIPKFHPYASMVLQAPVVIVVCGDLDIENSIDYINQDCSAATENILIAAHASGLGAVWLGVVPREKRIKGVKKLLNLPDHIVPVSMVVMGYPDEKIGPADRYRPQRIHQNSW